MRPTIRKIKCVITTLFLITVVQEGGSNAYAVNGNNQQEPDEKVWNWNLKGQSLEGSLFASKITGVTYPYHVYLPTSYANSSERSYPVMYVMDGQWGYKDVAKSIDRDNREVIVVAIEQGGPEGSNRRKTDYLLPGAILYLDFFRQEFLPLIESTYRIDANNRSFQGTSLSGIITTAFLFLDDHKTPLFKNFIANDASYQFNSKPIEELIEKRLKIDNRIESNLYLTSALPFVSNHFLVMDFIEKLEGYKIPGLNIYHKDYPVSHKAVLPAAIDDTLELIYGKSKL